MELERLSAEDFLEFLLSKNFSTDVVESFRENGVDGTTFLHMEDEHFKEVAPRVVDRINLKKLQSSYMVSYKPRDATQLVDLMIAGVCVCLCVFNCLLGFN